MIAGNFRGGIILSLYWMPFSLIPRHYLSPIFIACKNVFAYQCSSGGYRTRLALYLCMHARVEFFFFALRISCIFRYQFLQWHICRIEDEHVKSVQVESESLSCPAEMAAGANKKHHSGWDQPHSQAFHTCGCIDNHSLIPRLIAVIISLVCRESRAKFTIHLHMF